MRRGHALGVGLLLLVLLSGLSAAGCAQDRSAALATPDRNPTQAPTVAPEADDPPPAPTPEPPAPTAPPSPTPEPTATPEPSSTPEPSATPQPTATPTRSPYIVVIDPGHGGVDLGARSWDEHGRMLFHESQVNLELGLLVRDELERRGFQVVMTREGDYSVNADERDVDGDGVFNYTLDESQARVDLANQAGAHLLLSLHQNAFEYPDGRLAPDVGGAHTFYCADRPFGDENHRFATLVHQAVLAAFADLGYDITDRGVQADEELVTPDSTGRHIILLGPQSARIVRPSQMPGALSEPLFITHAIEAQLARDPVALARLAVGYADAVEAFFRGDDPRE